MRWKSFSIWMASAVLLAGCAVDKPRAYKMHQTFGKMTRGVDVGFRAICHTLIAGSHQEFWTGEWTDQERAMRDAVEHNKQYPGHDATIEH